MPAQVYQSTLAKRLGQKVVAAHQEVKDKPLEIGGFRDLPPDIKNGIAQLSSCGIQVHGQEVKSEHLRGQEFFQAFGVAKFPKSTPLGPVEGLRTRFVVELCDEPARGKREARSFAENWADFQGFFQRFGISPPPATAVTADAIMSYYNAAMKALLQRKPHFGFTTREWTPPAVPGQAAPKPMTFETWFEECQWNGTADPGAGVTTPPSTTMQPEPFTEPPQAQPAATSEPSDDPTDEVIALVEIVMADPNRLTEQISDEAAQAAGRLTELAKAAGATDEQIAAAADYDIIGQMALGVFEDAAPPSTDSPPVVGGKAKFRKRDSKGEPLKDAKKEPFPAQEIEIVTVDTANKTVTAKTKDGKPVTDIRKKVINIKWEWLE